VYGELDVSFKPTIRALSSFFIVPRVCGVVARRSRLNITETFSRARRDHTGPNDQVEPYQGKENGVAIVVGDHLFLPVRIVLTRP